MKTNLLKISFFAILLALVFTSCSEDKEVEGPSTVNETVVAVPFFVVNENGEMPSAPDQKLYELRQKNPITAPNGRQITWADFAMVSGKAEVQCKENGVEYTLTLAGLIPNGVYTIWDVIFQDPGMDPTDPMLGLDGLGAAGKGDGSDNAFTASATGTASITIFSPAGALSMVNNEQRGACPLTDNFEWHIVGAYHLDNKTHGPSLGPDGTAVEQFGFIFKSDEN